MLFRSRQEYDLIISADTLCYFGELTEVAAAACGALRPGGYLAFTVEALDEAQASVGHLLAGHGRYAHARGYLFEFRGRNAAAVGGTDKRSDAGSRDKADGDIFLLENFENADVGDTAGESAAQGKTYGGHIPGDWGGAPASGKLATERLYRVNNSIETLPQFTPALTFTPYAS